MRVYIYLFIALLPITFTLAHDIWANQGGKFEFLSLGFYFYHYLPAAFYWIKNTFVDTSFTGVISWIMGVSVFSIAFLLSAAGASYIIYAKSNNIGPFRSYLTDISEIQKKWLNQDNLGSRFSGGKAHSHGYNNSDV